MIRRGDIGHVAQAQTSYYRNSLVGQWRYYPLTREMTPKTIDWDMWLGTKFSVFPGQPLAAPRPFDRAVWAQWRCYWDFGGGMFTDLFVHRTTRIISAMGVRYPARVVGGGGIYLEYDDRDVPDVATIVADYDEGCQLLITATMINDYGHRRESSAATTATVQFTQRKTDGKTEYGAEITAADRGQQAEPRPATRYRRRPQWVGGGIGENDGDAAAVGELPRVRPQPATASTIARRSSARPRSRRWPWACRATAPARRCSGTRKHARPCRPTPAGRTRWERAASSAASRARSSAGRAATRAARWSRTPIRPSRGRGRMGRIRHPRAQAVKRSRR